jgi:hypothetical protein
MGLLVHMVEDIILSMGEAMATDVGMVVDGLVLEDFLVGEDMVVDMPTTVVTLPSIELSM